MPDEANPDQKTSTVPPPSTPVPTEPPNSKPTFFAVKLYFDILFSIDRLQF